MCLEQLTGDVFSGNSQTNWQRALCQAKPHFMMPTCLTEILVTNKVKKWDTNKTSPTTL